MLGRQRERSSKFLTAESVLTQVTSSWPVSSATVIPDGDSPWLMTFGPGGSVVIAGG